MYELMVREEIDIKHKIRGEGGEFGVLHEHHLVIDVFVELPPPEESFQPTREIIDLVAKGIREFDSSTLNLMPEFEHTRFLLEDLARVVFNSLRATFSEGHLRIDRVEIGDEVGRVKIIYRT